MINLLSFIRSLQLPVTFKPTFKMEDIFKKYLKTSAVRDSVSTRERTAIKEQFRRLFKCYAYINKQYVQFVCQHFHKIDRCNETDGGKILRGLKTHSRAA